VSFLLDPKPRERILDACAAPGGKTTHISEITDDSAQVMVVDPSARGLEKLRENVRKLHLASVTIARADAGRRLPRELALPYDRILVDAPCSGFETLRSHPEAKWNKSDKDVTRVSRLQKKILDNVAAYVKPNGVMVYAACTLTREENEAAVETFLESHRDFCLEEAAPCLPGDARSLTRGPYLFTLPHRHDTDGFFAARLRKARS
jgi:16S rRNA (cytosine967-C5)-methyltransferase